MHTYLKSFDIKKLAVIIMVLAVAPMVSVSAEDLPQPQMIINKYIKATGGEAAHKAIKNRTMKGAMSIVAMGMSGTMVVTVEGKNSSSVMTLDGFGEFLSGVKEGVAWSSNPMAGDSIMEGDEAAGALRGLDLAEWVNWEKHYASAETVAEEAVGDATAWKVTFTTEGGDTTAHWFDKDSGLIIQSDGPGMGGPATTILSDYRDIGNGVLMAHSNEMETANGAVEITWESIEVNSTIDASTFDVPDSIASLMSE